MRPPPRLLLVLVALLPGLTTASLAEADGASRRIGTVAAKDEAFLRVAPEALARLGAPDAARISVTRRGEPVPVASTAAGLVFLAEGHATDASAWGVYELWLHDGKAPATVPAPSAGPLRDGALAPTRAMRVSRADRVHGSLEAGRGEVYDHPAAPTWFLAWIPPGKAVSTDLDPAGAAAGADQALTATVWATRLGTVAIRARWGEADLGVSTRPAAAGGATFQWRVPGDRVPTEGTALVLQDVSPPAPPPPEQDVSDGRGTLWVDALTLEGEVTPVVDGRLRAVELTSDARLRLTPRRGESPVYVAAKDDVGRAVSTGWRWRRDASSGAIDVRGDDLPLRARVFASDHAQDVEPRPAGARADPLAAAAAARHLVLAVPELLEASRALAAHRTAHGIPSVVVPVADVYDAYGYGEGGSAPIRAFLLDCMRRPGPPLAYVLLAGDAIVDRTDMAPSFTIPAPMARTMYNGATPADRLYTLPPDGGMVGGPSIGRLPFRDGEAMASYVRRLIDYETHPPADATRRMLRFITNESRFGPVVDRLLEGMFGTIVANRVPASYDVEITFASQGSPYLWPPPEMNEHVIDGLNAGSLFTTYVGHGFGRGFDQVRVGGRVFPVLHVDHADRIACRGTPPVMFVVACTTATFDQPGWKGVGETLLERPQGPIAYWGATRVCHPAANVLLGRAITQYVAQREGAWRLGDILGRARDEVLEPSPEDAMRGMIDFAIRSLAKGAAPERLALEGTWMYTLLGDPALRVAFPASDVAVEATAKEASVEVVFRAPLPDGTVLHASLEVPRNARAHEPEKVEDPLDPASFPTIRENHRRVNDLALVREDVVLEGGRATWTVAVPTAFVDRRLVVKAWTIAEGDVHQGGVLLSGK